MKTINDRLVVIGWLVSLLLLAAWVLYMLVFQRAIDTNILSLISPESQNTVVESAVERFNEKQTRKIVVAISHDKIDRALQAINSLHEEFKAQLDITFSGENSLADLKEISEFYQRYKTNLISDEQYRTLVSGDFDSLTGTAYKTLYSPVSIVTSSALEADPFFFFAEFLQGLASESAVRLYEGWPYVERDEKHYFLLVGDLKKDAFSLDYQEQVVGQFDRWAEEAQRQYPGVDLLKTGTIFYAHKGVESARSEVSTVGVGSGLAILLMFILIFKSLKPLGLALLTLLFSVVAAAAVVLFVADMHLIAFVFGATLLGISIDYGFHFFSHMFFEDQKQSGREVVHKIRPALVMGFLSSSLAYFSLVFVGFNGLKQIALFAVVGLLSSLLVVLFVYPLIFGGGYAIKKQVPAFIVNLERLALPVSANWKLLFLGLLGLVASFGVMMLSPNDDIRLLQPVSKELRGQQLKIERLLEVNQSQSYFVIVADSLESLLQKEETLKQSIVPLREAGVVNDVMMLSNWLPSIKKQQQVRDTLSGFYQSESAVDYLQAIDIAVPDINQHSPVLNGEAIAESPLATKLNDFLVRDLSQPVSIVFPIGVRDTSQLKRLENQANGIYWQNRVAEISAVFQSYRQQASRILMIASAIIFGILVFKYGLVQGLLSAGIPVVSCFVVVAILALAKVPFNLFHLLGMMVVLGLGLDYAIFMSEKSGVNHATYLAIFLSAVTTLLAFGLLSLSSTPAVASFGLVVLLGVLLIFCLSFLLLAKPQHKSLSG